MWNIFKKNSDEVADKFRQLAQYAKEENTEQTRELLEQVFRLHADHPAVQKNRVKFYHFLVDYFIHGEKGLQENIRNLLNVSHLNVPYDDPYFIVIAISRQALSDLDEALENARFWHGKNPNDTMRQKLLRALLIHKHEFSLVAEISRQLFETDEDEFVKDERGYYQVFDVEGEHEFVNGEKCICGGYFEWMGHNNRSSEGLTENIGKCPQCKIEKTFLLSNANRTFYKNLEKFARQLGL